METAEAVISRWGRMAGDRAPWDGEWKDVAELGLPRKGNIQGTETGPAGKSAQKLYDTTLIECIATLASFHANSITPNGAQWFAWEAPEQVKSDEADAWYNRASETAIKIMAGSNFHTMLNEAFEDRSGFGISCMAAFEHPETRITFQTHPVGTYCVEEDADGNVNTIFLRREYSIYQLFEMFGEKVLNGNGKLATSLAKYREKGENANHFVIHAVFPRIDRKPNKRDKFNMKFASLWVAEDGEGETRLLERSGFEELAYMASRYLKASGSKQQYGYSPFQQVKGNVINANKSKQILQVVRQKQAVPPVLQPDDLVGNLDLRPGGKTVFNSKNSNLPQEWLTKSNPQGMVDEIEDDRNAIRRAYHYDVARMFADREKQMTAAEVNELAAEKLLPQSTTFTRFTADFKVLMDRIFAILFRAGSFGKIPESVILKDAKGRSTGFVPPPKTIYQSRLALALRMTETAAADRTIERAANLSAAMGGDPAPFDNLDTDEYIRSTGRNSGVSESLLRPVKDRDALRQARAEAAAAQMQLEQAKLASETARNAGVKIQPAA